METSLQLLTKLLVSKFYIWQGERSQRIIFRSLGWVARWCWWSCKVLFKHAWHPVRNIDHNICMPLQMLGGCLFDLQAVGGWQYHFFSSFVCAGCSWTDITTRRVLQSTPAHMWTQTWEYTTGCHYLRMWTKPGNTLILFCSRRRGLFSTTAHLLYVKSQELKLVVAGNGIQISVWKAIQIVGLGSVSYRPLCEYEASFFEFGLILAGGQS